jgi:hypothetical protein
MVIKVPIIVSYNDKGTKQAVKGLGSLTKSFKNMGLTSKLSFAAATTAVTVFTKKAVTAALEESKAVAVLNNQLKNLGLAFAATGVNAYIDSLQRATGVSEDQLRPAFSQLIRATNDLGKAQQLLALSLDISAANGKSVEAVTMSLNRAYLGNTTALGRLGVGLTKAELKTLSFEQIQERLTKLFAGSAKAAVDTYAGSMAKLQIAAKEATETIGFALIDGVTRLGDEKGIDSAAESMARLAAETGFVITGISVLADKISNSKIGKAIDLFILTPLLSPLTALGLLGRSTVAKELTPTNRQSPRVAEQAAAKAAKARKKEIADRSKIVTITKAQAANEKLSRMFDMDSIQLAAALQGKLSKEDEARVKALQALKTEDKNDDIKALDDLETAKRQATLDEIARMKSVVEESKKSNAEIIADARTRIAAIQGLVSGLGTNAPFLGHLGLPSGGGGTNVNAGLGATNLPTDLSNMPVIGGGRDLIDEFNMEGTRSSAGPSSVTVNVNPTGSGFIGNVDDFERVVQTAIQQLNRAGNSLTSAGS